MRESGRTLEKIPEEREGEKEAEDSDTNKK